MNTELQHGKDFDVIDWDWKAECPWEDCVRLGRKYKYYRQPDCGDDHIHVLFSNVPIQSDERAAQIIIDHEFRMLEENP